MGLVLQTQSRLSDVTLPLAADETNGLPGINHVRGNLSSLRKIHIFVWGDLPFTYEGLIEWFPQAPVLKEILDQGRSLSRGHKFSGWSGTSPLKLRSVFLTDLDLPDFGAKLDTLLDLTYLEALDLQNCAWASSMLRSLTQHYRSTDSCALRVLGQRPMECLM